MAGERIVKIKFVGDERGLRQSADRGETAVSKWSKGVQTASRAAGVAMAAAGAAAVAAFTAAATVGLENSKITAKLAAQLGATGPAAKLAGDAAGDLYARGVVSSLDEAAAAVKATFQNNLIPKDAGKAEIDAIAGRVSTLAVTLDEDASAVGRAVSQMLRTGIADSAEEAFDILAKGTQLGINKSEDLLDTFNEYGTQFRKLGLDGPQALGLLNQAIKAGARDSDVAADALKEFSIRAIDGSAASAAGFKALGLDAKLMGKNIARGGDFANEALDVTLDRLRGIQDPIKRNAAAVQLFGTQAEDLGDALFAMDPSEAAAGIGALGGAAAQAGKTLEQSAGAKVSAFGRMLQGQLITALAATVGWLQRNQDTVKILAIVLGPLAGIIATIVAAMKVWAVVQAALNVVMSANPIGIVIVAVAALVATIVLLYKNSETARKIIDGAWKGISTGAVWLWNTILKPIFFAWVAYIKLLASVAVWLWKNVIVPSWNGIVAAAQFLYNGYKRYIALVVSVIKGIASTVVNVYNTGRDYFNRLVSYIGGLPGRISRAASGLFDGIKNAFRNAVNYIIDGWNRLSFTLPSINTPFGKIGGTRLDTPNIGRLASGGWAQPYATYTVNERGQEMLTMGSRAGYVHSAGDTAAAAGPPTVHVYIGDRELTDIVDVQVEQSNRSTRRRATARGLVTA